MQRRFFYAFLSFFHFCYRFFLSLLHPVSACEISLNPPPQRVSKLLISSQRARQRISTSLSSYWFTVGPVMLIFWGSSACDHSLSLSKTSNDIMKLIILLTWTALSTLPLTLVKTAMTRCESKPSEVSWATVWMIGEDIGYIAKFPHFLSIYSSNTVIARLTSLELD